MRFYGGSPMAWLAEYPMAVVGAHLEMMERLQAGEALEAGAVAAIGKALDTDSWASRQWGDWGRAASRGEKIVKGPVPRDIGIGVRRVVRKKVAGG